MLNSGEPSRAGAEDLQTAPLSSLAGRAAVVQHFAQSFEHEDSRVARHCRQVDARPDRLEVEQQVDAVGVQPSAHL